MLILGRRPNESLRIGDDIVLTILAVDGERVKIGVQAPSHVRVLRQELYETIKQENLRAAQFPAPQTLLPTLWTLFKGDEGDSPGGGTSLTV